MKPAFDLNERMLKERRTTYQPDFPEGGLISIRILRTKP
jgi:hypothetical protein